MILITLLIEAISPAGQTRAENRSAAMALHQRMDVNHDGYVTFEELNAAATSMVSPTGILPGQPIENPVARRQFNLADTNHDGRISLQEAVDSADRAFTAADTNHDDSLSPEERGAYAAKTIAELRSYVAGLKAPPCQLGAACDTGHRSPTRESKAPSHP